MRLVLYLHVFVFDLLTGGDAVRDVEVDKLRRQIHSCGQPADKNNPQRVTFPLLTMKLLTPLKTDPV